MPTVAAQESPLIAIALDIVDRLSIAYVMDRHTLAQLILNGIYTGISFMATDRDWTLAAVQQDGPAAWRKTCVDTADKRQWIARHPIGYVEDR